jgi:hypothetical protein
MPSRLIGPSAVKGRRSRFSARMIFTRIELLIEKLEELSYGRRKESDIETDALISSIRYCAQGVAAPVNHYRQAVACPRVAQKSATYRSPRYPQWQHWCHRQAHSKL